MLAFSPPQQQPAFEHALNKDADTTEMTIWSSSDEEVEEEEEEEEFGPSSLSMSTPSTIKTKDSATFRRELSIMTQSSTQAVLELVLFMDKYGTAECPTKATVSSHPPLQEQQQQEEEEKEEPACTSPEETTTPTTPEFETTSSIDTDEEQDAVVIIPDVALPAADEEEDDDDTTFAAAPEVVKALGWDETEVPEGVRVVRALDDHSSQAMQYAGAVGTGARSIRAIDALPRPQYTTVTQVHKAAAPVAAAGAPKRRNRLLRKQKAAAAAQQTTYTTTKTVFEPFVEAYAVSSSSADDAAVTECTSARLASYFEVEILQGPKQGVEEAKNEEEAAAAEPCLAVGITLHQFDWNTSLPGWGDHSFGYHGDNGSALANGSKKLVTYGPTFGVGDVVGCGIDYQTRKVFYTLNGNFLGYAFTLTTAQLTKGAWIPTVGLDSHACVQYNRGTTQQPFMFDLQCYCNAAAANKNGAEQDDDDTTVASERVQV